MTAKNNHLAPIGVFDSGAGGLTILSDLRTQLPNEHFIYLGDTANCPYGTRTESDIVRLSRQACDFLINQGVKMIVVACNTASQASLNILRATYDIPFVGVVPAVKPAARMTQKGRIGVAATNRAVQAEYFHQLIADFAADVEVYAVGCPELVTLVEEGNVTGPAVEQILQQSLQPLLQHDIDVMVLGCTHFPALRSAIERVVGPSIQVIDSGKAIARRAQTILTHEQLIRPSQRSGGDLHIWSSGDASTFSQVASAILGYPVIARHANFPSTSAKQDAAPLSHR